MEVLGVDRAVAVRDPHEVTAAELVRPPLDVLDDSIVDRQHRFAVALATDVDAAVRRRFVLDSDLQARIAPQSRLIRKEKA